MLFVPTNDRKAFVAQQKESSPWLEVKQFRRPEASFSGDPDDDILYKMLQVLLMNRCEIVGDLLRLMQLLFTLTVSRRVLLPFHSVPKSSLKTTSKHST